VQLHYDEGTANRIDPEPCTGIREDAGEASVGEHAGQPLSRETVLSRAPTLSKERKATWASAQTRAPVQPGVVVDPGMHGSSLYGNRDISGSATFLLGGYGPQREGEEP
jgi:hypothetical protein